MSPLTPSNSNENKTNSSSFPPRGSFSGHLSASDFPRSRQQRFAFLWRLPWVPPDSTHSSTTLTEPHAKYEKHKWRLEREKFTSASGSHHPPRIDDRMSGNQPVCPQGGSFFFLWFLFCNLINLMKPQMEWLFSGSASRSIWILFSSCGTLLTQFRGFNCYCRQMVLLMRSDVVLLFNSVTRSFIVSFSIGGIVYILAKALDRRRKESGYVSQNHKPRLIADTLSE